MPDTNSPGYLHLKLLGPPSLSIDNEEIFGFRSAKAQALLYYLAATSKSHRRSFLANLFWPDVSEAKANSSLRVTLSSLRKQIPEHLDIDRQSVSLNANRVWVDTQQFTQLLQKVDDPALTMQQNQTAVSLYTGDFLDGFCVDDAPEFEQWVTTTREYFQQRIIHVLMDLARWHAVNGDPAASLATLSRLLSLAPGNEAAHRLMMQVLANTGQRAAAILQFDTLRHYLAEELGVDPEPETMALYAQLLEGENIDERPGELQVPGFDAPPRPRSEPARDDAIDWGDMPGRTPLHGRTHQLTDLTNRLISERCTLVVISGIGGVGKTALAAELTHHMAELPASSAGFTRIIWRSLLNAPRLSALLDDWLRILAPSPLARLPEELDVKLGLLFAELDQQRVLLVLDNVESIMASGEQTGGFCNGFDEYRQLLARMAFGRHQSCLLLTTREIPIGVERLTAEYSHVYDLALTGLSAEQGTELLLERQVKGERETLRLLVDHYSGNPLALKLVAATVSDLYGGDVDAFLRDDAVVFDDIRTVLDQHFDRLSELGRDLLVWLAINREPVGFDELQDDLVVPAARRELLETLRALKRTSLLQEVAPKDAVTDRNDAKGPRITLHNVVMEYIEDRLISTFQAELKEHRPGYFHRYALCKVGAPEYVQDMQRRLFLTPLARWLIRHEGAAGIRRRLRRLLDDARQDAALVRGYIGANVIHLMLHLASELQHEDFSSLSLRQADLRTASLIDVNLQNAELSSTRFANSFGIVSSVAVSPDGQFLAAGAGHTVVVWRLQTLKPYSIFEGHLDNIAAIAFAPDGQRLVSADYGDSIFIWDVAAAGQRVNRFEVQAGNLCSIAFSPDGEMLAGGYSGHIVVWNWRRGEQVATLMTKERVTRIAFASSTELLACTGYQGEIQFWDVTKQKLVDTMRNSNIKRVTNAMLIIGRSLIFTSGDEAINLWDRHSRKLIATLDEHNGWVRALAVSPQEEYLASSRADGTLTIWDLHSRRPIRVLSGHQGEVRALTFTPDGQHLISGGYDETVRIWDFRRGLEQKRLQGHLRWADRLDFSPDGQTLAGSTLNGMVYLWCAQDLKLLHILHSHKAAVRAVAFSPDSQLLATGSDDGYVHLWDVQSGAPRHVLQGHDRFVRAVAFDHRGRFLASGSHDNTIGLWDVATGRLVQKLANASASIMHGMVFHPHNDLLAYGDTSNRVHLYRVEAGEVIASVAMDSQSSVLAFSSLGQYLACGAYDGSVMIWEMVSENSDINLVERHRIHPSTQCIWRLLFNPDDSLIAWNGETREIYLASVTDGQLLYEVPGNHSTTCIAFSGEGQSLLADGSGLDMYVYNARTDKAIDNLTGHTSTLTSIVTNPVSSTIASSDVEGVVKLWDVTSGASLASSWVSGPYQGMNITGTTGLTRDQRQALIALGALDSAGCRPEL